MKPHFQNVEVKKQNKKEFVQHVPLDVMSSHHPFPRRLVEGLCCLLAVTLLLFLQLDVHRVVLPKHSLYNFFAVKKTNAETFSEKVARRQTRLSEVCERHKASLVWDEWRRERSMRRHLWDVVNHLVYCPIAKVASTTWFSNFLAWSHIKRANVPHVLEQFEEVGSRNGKGKDNWEGEAGGRGIRTLARYIYQAPEASDLEELTTQFKENTGFLIVRHPFVRLVSAYEDKMLSPHPFPYAYHHRVQEEIKSARGERQVRISFPEDVLQSGRLQKMLQSKAVTMEGLLTQPSFPEFVDWLVMNRAGKEASPAAWAEENAWLPYYAVCPVCQLPYKVLKLEDPEEMDQLMQYMKLKLPHWATPVHTIGGTSSSASKAVRYFAELNRSQVESLSDLFYLDLLLFGYSTQEYLDLAKERP